MDWDGFRVDQVVAHTKIAEVIVVAVGVETDRVVRFLATSDVVIRPAQGSDVWTLRIAPMATGGYVIDDPVGDLLRLSCDGLEILEVRATPASAVPGLPAGEIPGGDWAVEIVNLTDPDQAVVRRQFCDEPGVARVRPLMRLSAARR